MNIESAVQAAIRGAAVSDLTMGEHLLDVSPVAVDHHDGTTIAEGRIAHRTASGATEQLHFQLEVRHHRLVGSKRRLESATGLSVAVARTTSPWIGSAEHLLALFAQRLAADPDFDRIEIAFPHTAEVH